MIKKVFIVVVIAIGLITSSSQFVLADFNPANWQYEKNINVPAVSGPTYTTVKLDRDVAAGSNRFKDVRIIANNGQEIGYQLVTKNAEVESDYHSSAIFNQSTQGGQTMFMIDLGVSGAIHNQLDLITSSQNFKRQVSVYVADAALPHTSAGWGLVTDKGYIYNYSDARANFNAGSGQIVYPKQTSRYIRVVIHPGEGAINVRGVRVYKYEASSALDEFFTENITQAHNLEQKTSELTLDLQNSGIPTHTISITTENQNFNRRVVVQGSNDGTSWNLLNQGYIFKINTTLFRGANLTIQYPESFYRYIRVVVFNEDNAALQFGPMATVSGTVRNVVFEAQPSQSYKLYYGNPNANSPQYDIARFFQYIESQRIPVATLSAAMPNSAYTAPAAPQVPFSDRYPYLLNIVLVLVVIVLGGMVYVYIRKIQKAQSETVPPQNETPNSPPPQQ